jgi:hypothetical protein
MNEIHGSPGQNSIAYSHEEEVQKLVHMLKHQEPSKGAVSKDPPQIIFADNHGAMKLTKNPQYHNCTKY